MSVLETPIVDAVPEAVKIANNLKQEAQMAYRRLIDVFNGGSIQFWASTTATPTEIAAALGTDGKELFQLHSKIGALLAEINPAAIADGLAVVDQFFYNEDGSIGIGAPPAQLPAQPNPANPA